MFGKILLLMLFMLPCFAAKPVVLFIGSSTIDYWRDRLATDFPSFQTIDLGVSATTYRYITANADSYAQHYPFIKNIVVYAGDNDIAIPFKTPASVAYDFSEAMIKLHSVLPGAQIFVFSIKPCPAILIRASTKTVYQTNALIMRNIVTLNNYSENQGGKRYLTFVDIFSKMLTQAGLPDSSLFCMPLGIHLNNRGYKVWAQALTPLLNG